MSRDLEAHRAANGARYYGGLGPDRIVVSTVRDSLGRRSLRLARQPGPSRTYAYRNGLRVTLGVPKHQYAEPRSPIAKYAHRPRHLFIVWDRQKVVHVDTRFLCGGNSTTAMHTDTPTLPECPKCIVAMIGYDEAARLLGDA